MADLSYADLFNKVAAQLESGQHFSIAVKTERTKQGPDTTWEVYVSFKEGGSILVDGVSADEAFRNFTAELHDEPESLEQTSSAVANAEVG